MRIKQRAAGLAALATFASMLGQPARAVDGPAPAPAIADWNGPVDFTALREQYGARDDYDQVCDDAQLTRQMNTAANQQQDEEVMRLTAQRLAACPVDPAAHLYRGSVLKRQGHADEAAAHFRWSRGLLQSIYESGDGKTPATAFRTVSVREEYQLLTYMHLKSRAQSLLPDPARDRIEAVDANGAVQVLYFFPKAHFVRLAKRMHIPLKLEADPAPAAPGH